MSIALEWNTSSLTAEPNMIKKNNMNCWNAFRVLRLIVFSPASVIALMVKYNESV